MPDQGIRKLLLKEFKNTDTLIAHCNIGGKTERLFVGYDRTNDLYTIDFGGRYGDIDSTVNLLARLGVHGIES